MDISSLIAQELSRFIRENPQSQVLLIADEAFDTNVSLPTAPNTLYAISNRIDTTNSLLSQGINTCFTDFQLEPDIRFDAVFYRVSKEKSVTHHCLNLINVHAKDNAPYVIGGRKDEGIKTYFDKCRKDLGHEGHIKKLGTNYLAQLTVKSGQESLPDDAYDDVREISKWDWRNRSFSLFGKPGLFGWKKIDAGSLFLLKEVDSALEADRQRGAESALDLGCGGGLLTLALATYGFPELFATDNGAAAMISSEATFNHNGVEVTLFPDDCAAEFSQPVDIILCNPPFHSGTSTDASLTEKFARCCARLLSENGTAYFVVNAFIGIEKALVQAGLHTQQLANNRQFKVVAAKRSPFT